MSKVDRDAALILISQGKSNKEIAKLFQCDPSSISKIRTGVTKGREDPDLSFKRRISKLVVKTLDGCWVLPVHPSGNGYAKISYRGKSVDAHRASYSVFVGSIPECMFVLHKCDVRGCIRPSHLFLGTHADNMADMVDKGRSNRGTKHYSAVLTDDLVRAMRNEYKPGDSWMGLEKKYGINRGVLRPAILGITWKHVK